MLGDSDSLGDRGFQRATKKSFTFTSPYLGQLQRVRRSAMVLDLVCGHREELCIHLALPGPAAAGESHWSGIGFTNCLESCRPRAGRGLTCNCGPWGRKRALPTDATPPCNQHAQVHVQQVPHASDGSGVGWFLDRVEVSGPEGEHWSFPCSAWLGKEASHTGLNWGERCLVWLHCGGAGEAKMRGAASIGAAAAGVLPAKPKPTSPNGLQATTRAT